MHHFSGVARRIFGFLNYIFGGFPVRETMNANFCQKLTFIRFNLDF